MPYRNAGVAERQTRWIQNPATDSPNHCNDKPLQQGDPAAVAHGTAPSAENAFVALVSGSFAPDLSRVILAWPSLDATTRAIILSLAGHGHDAEHGRAAL